jgi:hypothetical protein
MGMVISARSREWSPPELDHNNFEICFGSAGFAGIYVDTIEEDDQAGTFLTVIGDNTFSENEFANPTL